MKRQSVAGVDEAGLGPTLGPLVIGACLFRGEPPALEDLFHALEGVVARKPTSRHARLPIDDSKKLFAGRRTLAPLELTALTALRHAGRLGTCLEELVDPCDLGGREIVALPWYRRREDERELPGDVEADAVAAWGSRWPGELAARGLEHVAAFVRPVLEDELNGCFERGMNKADAVLTRLAPILRRLAELAAGDDLAITVDRLGGRRYYSDFLHLAFPFRPLRPLQEEERRSSYLVRDGDRTITITFEVEGDGRHLPVALASVMAKYLRELFVRRLNAFFLARKPGLRPTAGYAMDAQRWLDDAADVLSDDERAVLIRRR
jgi:ribonuclease HII